MKTYVSEYLYRQLFFSMFTGTVDVKIDSFTITSDYSDAPGKYGKTAFNIGASVSIFQIQ